MRLEQLHGAQEHLDLALLATLCAAPEDAASAHAMTYLYTGQAFHYLEDVSNQVHTVQVGLFDFFIALPSLCTE